MNEQLKNQRILFIGGSQGIGLAAAQKAHAAGAQVILAARNPERLRDAASQLGKGVSTLRVDVTDEPALKALFEEVGEFDHLVYTAASALIAPLADQTTRDFRLLIESKLIGQALAVKYGAPRIRAGGSVVLFSGIVSRKPFAGASAYAAVGAATEAAARTWAIEYAPLRINVVVPGIIDTPVWDLVLPPEAKAEHFRQVENQLPVGRVGHADDVASAVMFLMQNPFVNGATVEVDGGHHVI